MSLNRTIVISVSAILLAACASNVGSTEERAAEGEHAQEGAAALTTSTDTAASAVDAVDDSPDDPNDPVVDTSETGSLDVAPSAQDIAESNAAADLFGAAAPPKVIGHGMESVAVEDGVASAVAAGRCANPSPLAMFPVRGKHDTGYQRSPSSDSTSHWTCGNAYSNSDFVKHGCSDSSSHFGVDIWAARGTPVVASVTGTVAESEYSSYSGNKVTIQDACGWYHFNIHMKDRLVKKGDKVKAGQLIGHVSNTGTASNGVVHLHYSVYPGQGNYCQGRDPWSALKHVENDVCWTPTFCQGVMCAKNQTCGYWGSTLMCH